MIVVKTGVVFEVLRPEIYNIFPVIDQTWNRHAKETIPVITSAFRPGEANLLHAKDRALDIRSKNLSTDQKESILVDLTDALYQKGYDILLEDRGSDNEHFHIEYDPKPGRGL